MPCLNFYLLFLFYWFISFLFKEGPTGNVYLGRDTIEVRDRTMWKWDPRVGRNAQPEEIKSKDPKAGECLECHRNSKESGWLGTHK